MRMIMLAAASVFATTFTVLPAPAGAVMFAAASNGQCLANSGGAAVLQACSGPNQDSQINYVSSSNEFYGTLKQGGACLDVVNGNQVRFNPCNGSPGQTWKYGGATGQLNNGAGFCIVGSGGGVSVTKCPANYTWRNESYARIQALSGVAAGTSLAIKGNDVVNRNNPSQVVAAGAAAALRGAFPNAPVVAQGAGNVVAQGAGNVVAQGAGNVVAQGAGN